MSEAPTIEETAEIKAARAIGAASTNKDWQFAAKHWHRMAEDDESKRELLKLGAAAAKMTATEIYAGYSKYCAVGDWFQTGSITGQIVHIDPTGKYCRIAWYNTGQWSKLYTVDKYLCSDVRSWEKLPGRPF